MVFQENSCQIGFIKQIVQNDDEDVINTTISQRLPKLHKDILVISIANYRCIKKSYSEVLGLNAIDHLSINIVNPKQEMIFLSSTPYTGINVCKNDLWLYDRSIHPDVYEKQNFYWWDDCYLPSKKLELKLEKEIKNNLNLGFIITQKIDGFYLLYSFATREKDPGIKYFIEQYKDIFISMGNYCYSQVKHIYEQYAGNYIIPDFKTINFPNNNGVN